jgi:ubiquinone biosynthesis protein
MIERMKNEAPRYAQLLPELPRLLHQSLQQGALPRESPALLALLAEQRRTNRLLQGALWAALGFVAGLVLMQAASRWWG